MFTRRERIALGAGAAGILLMMVNTGRKRKKPAAPYEVTATDRLWLARAVEAEGQIREDVARTLVNLFVYAVDHGYDGTLTQMVRSYAQPVNPRWYVTGDKYKGKISTLTPGDRDKERDKALNRERVLSTRTSFTQATMDAVNAALAGEWNKDWTDYAAPFNDATGKGYTQRTEHKAGQNTFWTRSPGWGGYAVLPGNLLVKQA